jgi:hypothetical protein
VNTDNAQETESGEYSAVRYEGRTPLGLSCKVYIAPHSTLGFLVKIALTAADGYTPTDHPAKFYSYDPSNGTYQSPEQISPSQSLVLTSISLLDPSIPADPNQIPDYISNVELFQFSRLEFVTGTDVAQFQDHLNQATLDPSSFESYITSLNKVVSLDMAALHGDHYDFPSCRNFQAAGVDSIIFDFRRSDDDHDDDHEDDHDHDHQN